MTAPMNPVPLTPAVAAGAPVEQELAFHMAKLAVPIAVVVVALAAVIRGANGAWSALLAVVIVVLNMLLAATMLTWAARISANMLMGVALLGFLLRMILVTVVGIIYSSRRPRQEPDADVRLRDLLRTYPSSNIEWMLTWPR